MKKGILIFITASISLTFLIFFAFFNYNDNKLHLIICNVGQGDAIFIRTPSSQILIDGGPDKKVLECLSRHMPFWDKSLDAVILTHPDADHLSGIIDVIKRYRLDGFYTQNRPGKTQLYKLFTDVLAEKKLSAKYVARGDRLKLKDGAVFDIIWPASKDSQKLDQNIANIPLNQYSVIAVLKFGNFSVLLTGDAGSEVMDQLADLGDIGVLKVPHHGSKTGMDDYFLSSISPELAVISVGTNNRYLHPAKISLELLEKHKVKILRTDLNGEVEIVSDGSTWSVKTSQN